MIQSRLNNKLKKETIVLDEEDCNQLFTFNKLIHGTKVVGFRKLKLKMLSKLKNLGAVMITASIWHNMFDVAKKKHLYVQILIQRQSSRTNSYQILLNDADLTKLYGYNFKINIHDRAYIISALQDILSGSYLVNFGLYNTLVLSKSNPNLEIRRDIDWKFPKKYHTNLGLYQSKTKETMKG